MERFISLFGLFAMMGIAWALSTDRRRINLRIVTGGLLLQVVLHAQYAAEEGVFDMSDVQRAVTTKIISRHPHVFADVVAAVNPSVA